jgi:hypothetical protein
MLEEMNELEQEQERMEAIGRAKAAGLDPNKDLYSPENQEKIYTTNAAAFYKLG